MNKEQLFEAFRELFPDWAARVTGYRKIGSKVLAIKFVTNTEIEGSCEESRVFLYDNPNSWQFGTKLWRKRPEKLNKKSVEEVKNNESYNHQS